MENGYRKLYIEDWKRKGYAYETQFQGEEYHMIKENQNYLIMKNKQDDFMKSSANKTVSKFDLVPSRKEVLNQLNESRFDNLNKSPEVDTNTKRVPGFSFSKMSSRAKDLFGP